VLLALAQSTVFWCYLEMFLNYFAENDWWTIAVNLLKIFTLQLKKEEEEFGVVPYF
jgi:hypothetical protein